jgi:putative ABC transport system substrate-binding protein
MRRWILVALALVVAVGLALLSAPAAEALQPGKVARIGFLTQAPANPNFEGLRQGLRNLGWVEGQNLVIEYPSAAGRVERLPALATELVRLNVDVIVATALAVQAAKSATKTIPIVFVIADDPVATGLVASLARPGGNMTGLSSLNVELDAKRLALLKEAIPRLARAAVLFSPDDPAAGAMRAATERATRSVGVQLQIAEVRGYAELDGAIATVTRGGAEALAVLGSALFFQHQPRIAELAARARLPAISPWKQFPEAGGLMSYGANLPEMFRRAAVYVDKILKDAKPADLPVEQPTKFELVINLRTARVLGLTVPQSLLLRADQVIQ